MGDISFHEINIRSGLHKKKDLKEFLIFLFKKEKKRVARIDIIFCDDPYLYSLNKEFLKHDYYTDTMSFLLSRPKDSITGELYLSIDRIRANAEELKIPYQDEIVRVIIHSCLHLCGYKDHSKKVAGKMTPLQESYLKKWLVSRETK